MVKYFSNIAHGKVVLWCYLIWYCVTIYFYMDYSPQIWINSLGISLVIGIALLLSVANTGSANKNEPWQIFRLFMMPFCVSSYSALIKGKGFVLIFSPNPNELLIAASGCVCFCFFVYCLKWRVTTKVAR